MKRNVPARFVALLRAVNVGGTGALPMKTLAELCANLGLEDVRTYIQSGNVVFTSRLSKSELRSKMEEALKRKTGKPIDVIVRTGPELESILAPRDTGIGMYPEMGGRGSCRAFLATCSRW